MIRKYDEQRAMRRRLVRTVYVALGAGLTLAPLAACGGPDADGADGDGLTTIKIISTPVADSAFIDMAQEKGFYEEEGIEVERDLGSGGAASLPAVVAGEFDMATGNVVSTMIAVDKGLPVKIITPGGSGGTDMESDSGSIMVRGDSGIETPQDLVGKTVAVNTLENIGPLTINAALEAEGVAYSSIEYVEVPFPNMVAAIDKGQVDAGWVVEPFATQGKQVGLRPVLANYSGTAPELPVSATFTTEEYLAENRDTVEAFIRATKKSLGYIQNNPDEARALVAEISDLEPGLADQMTLPTWRSDFNVEAYEKMTDLAEEFGYISHPLPVDDLLWQG